MAVSSNGVTGLTPRQTEILEHARRDGEVLVEALAGHYEVTPQTIRRDLGRLCDARLLQRTHGGAVVLDGVSNMGYAARELLAAQEKARIGRRAAELIPNDASLFINIGTTTEQVARYLAQHVGLLVISNNINVINILRPSPDIQLMTAGGLVRREDGGIVGDETAEFIARFKVDFAVVSASAIEDDGALLDFDAREVRVTRAIIDNARTVILVADESKLHRSAPVRIGNIALVDHFVTDAAPGRVLSEHCRANEVSVEVAPFATEAGAERAARSLGRAYP